MKELLSIIEKEITAWDFYVPSLDNLIFIKEIENDINFLEEL